MAHHIASQAAIVVQAEKYAFGLKQLNLPEGSRLLMALDQRWESVALVWACLGLRLVPVPLSPTLTGPELDKIREDIDPAYELITRESQDELVVDSAAAFDRLPRCRPIHLTSGTTGRPKGVWSGWWTSELAEAALHEEVAAWNISADDINIVVSPLYHSAPLRFAINTVVMGGQLIVPARFDAQAAVELIRNFSPTTMFCVPTQLRRILDVEPSPEARDFKSLRLVVHAGSPCPPAVKHRALEVFESGVLTEFYGSTEGQFTIGRSEDWITRGSGVGFARPHRTLFADELNQLWCVVPPWATFEYFGDPSRTRAAWQDTPNGPAFTVGDLGRIDADGWVHIDARRTDLIISGGVNLYPREIESVLEQHPEVDDCAVIGRAHPDWGHEAVAVVVGTASPKDLNEFARQHLSRIKIPKEFIMVDRIPHTATGKIQRHLLIEQILGTSKG